MTMFEFGDVSIEQQELWFLVNRARSDPAAEGRRLVGTDDPLVRDAIEAFGVDITVLLDDLASVPPRAPVAWDPRLAAAAARHADDQVTNGSQSHRGSDGSLPRHRIRDAGVDASYVVEVISSHARSVRYAHASFVVDWGGDPPTGVQSWPTPPHRVAVLGSPDPARFTDTVGMAWHPTAIEGLGPFVVVQEFANSDATFVVGTVWQDEDGDGDYDAGEGIGGVEVRPDRGEWFAVTQPGGGYEFPMPAAGAISITFTLPNRTTEQVDVDLGGDNVLVDLVVAD